jgi:arylsulfatase A-like enzyme
MKKMLLATLAICTAMTGFLSIGLSANAQPNKSTKPEGTSPKPNIVYIVADDLGWKDLGFHGSDIKTPNLDKLAAGGVKLEQFYVQPMCTPTRAALLTGRYPFRYGLQTAVIPAGAKYGLATDEWLLPQALKEAGYTTAIIGKWHLGNADQNYWPRQRGFDYQYGPLIGEIDYFTHEAEGIVDWFRDNKQLVEKGYSTTLLGDDAVRFINEQNPTKPFFLYLAFNAPHTPYQAPQEYLDRYKNITDEARRAYAGSITAMDDQIGRVVDALDKKKMRDDTLIVFMSDNGGTRNAMFTGAIADVSKIKIPCDNGPYREGKGTVFEGGTRVVAFANWPGHIPAGTTVKEIIHVVDMYSTLTKLAGASIAKCKPLDGLDVWGTISEGKMSPRTEVVYNIEPFHAAVRQGEWKLIWRPTLPSSEELYNIAQDPSEKNNVAAEHPEIVAALQKRAQELAAAGVKPLFMQEGFEQIVKWSHLPPAFPGEEFGFDQER